MKNISTEALIILIVIVYSILLLTQGSLDPVMEPDSASYLLFLPSRTAGYPLFLRLVGLPSLVWVQTLLYAATAGGLGIVVFHVFRQAVPAILLVLALCANPELSKYHAHVMTESLFVSVLTAYLASAILLVHRPTGTRVVIAAVLVALTAVIRPAAYGLIPVLVGLVLLNRRRYAAAAWRPLVASLLIPLVMVGTERLYSASVHGGAETSLAGRHFFAKAAMIDAPPGLGATESSPVRKALFEALEQDFAPIRTLLQQATAPSVYAVLEPNFETCVEYACADDLRRRIDLPAPALNQAMLAVALARMQSAPGATLMLAWRHYRALWTLYSQSHPALAPMFDGFIAAHQPLPFAPFLPASLSEPTPVSRLATFVRPAITAVGWITGLLALIGVVAVIRGDTAPRWQVAGFAAACVHLSFVLIAFTGVGIPRYTVSMWPAMMLALIMALSAIAAPGGRVGRPRLHTNPQ
ncbi:MAG: hypothetical protein P4M00_10460 [Azospirillaceae bacterium]|nr:hypothetical protein [Azospirillaceae bacterium]